VKRVWLFLIVGIFLIGIVSAGSCNGDQTIMKLYQENNSHGALWNDTHYGVDICYLGVAPTIPHPECTIENSFLWLSDTYNAHASTTKTAEYSEGVCYGDLQCTNETITDGLNCSDGSVPILSLYSNVNSHMAAGNHDGYDVKICCDTSAIYWADANGVEITTERPNIGDTIQAVKTGTSSGIFTIKDSDWIDESARDIVGNGSSGNLIGEWTITQEDLDNAGGKDNIYFIVDGDGDNPSNKISINGTYDDSLMEVTIVTPVCGSNYSVDSNVIIEVTATDEDDFLNGSVSIGGVVRGTFVNGGVSFPYNFTVAGNVQIVAEAVNTRGKRARHISNVMILGGDGTYVAACIDKPKDFSDMEESKVDFDASTTRAIVVSNGVSAFYTPENNSNKFSWYWSFMPENIIRECSGNCGSEYYRFTAEFPIAGDNSAGLRVEFL